MTHRELPEWPAKLRSIPQNTWGDNIVTECDCWASRLRVAVEALKHIHAFDPGVFRPLADEIAICNAAADALSRIGPLPDDERSSEGVPEETSRE